jgi:hypothetical protein
MRTRFHPLLCLALVACANPNGCGEDIYAESGGTRDTPPTPPRPKFGECWHRHGTCNILVCPNGHNESTDDCPQGLFAPGCCIQEPLDPPPTFTPTDPPSSPYDHGDCNGLVCPTGCACRAAVSEDDGACVGVCDCGDAGAGDAGDAGAGDADAPADAGDAGDTGDTGDETDPPPDGSTDAFTTCGAIRCSTACDCTSQSLSRCICYSGACTEP